MGWLEKLSPNGCFVVHEGQHWSATGRLVSRPVGLPSDSVERLAADPMCRPVWPNALQTCCKISSFMSLMLMPSQSASKTASKRVLNNWSWIIGISLAVSFLLFYRWPKELLLVHETTKWYSVYHQKQHHRMNRIFSGGPYPGDYSETIRRLLKTHINYINLPSRNQARQWTIHHFMDGVFRILMPMYRGCPWLITGRYIISWLVVSTPLKNISQLDCYSQYVEK